MGKALSLLLVGLSLCGPARAEQVPPDLAALGARLYGLAADDLAAVGDDAVSRDAARRAASAFRRSGLPHWAPQAVTLDGAGAEAARLLGLDPTSEADRAALRELLSMSESDLTAALRARRPELGDAELADLVAGLAKLRVPSGTGHSHTVDLGEGERVTIDWDPHRGLVSLRARSDGTDGRPEYDTTLVGHARLSPNPRTGDLDVELEVDPASTAQVVAGPELEELRGSILGEWQAANGDLYVISAADPSAGDIRADAEDYDRLIAEAEAELERIKSALEYVWTNPESGAVERQQRFRRLPEPWVYEGQRYLNDNAEAEMAALQGRIDGLRSRQQGADRPPAVREDPVGFEQNRAAEGARALRIEVHQPSGYSYAYDQASFDGRRIAARRTLQDVREINQDLPAEIKRQLIASWSPPDWLELEAEFDPVTGAVRMTGDLWGLHVTYSLGSFGAGAPQVKGIDTPYPRPLRLGASGADTRVALGAAADALP